MVLVEQIAALLDFLETQPELALGHLSRTNEGRSLAKRLWEECANTLNSVTPDCPSKSPTEWRSFFNEYKSKVTKKIKLQKREISATGGGPAKKITLTPLQERLNDLLGRDIGETLAGVRHSPLSISNIGITRRMINVEPRTRKFGPIISSTNQPQRHQPPRRRLQRVPRYPTEDRDQTALEASQARLERIESRNAEATLELARATNNLASALHNLGGIADEASNRLAAALERIGDSLSIPTVSID